MVSNKKRLYVALYPSGTPNNPERQYHWGFLIGPKDERGEEVPGMRFHVKNIFVDGKEIWTFEEVQLRNVRMTATLLVRIVIAKIEDENRLKSILRSVPVVQKDPAWRCRTWLANALDAIAKDGKAVGTAQLDWREIEVSTRKYVADKKSAGRYDAGQSMRSAPTMDLIEGKETVA